MAATAALMAAFDIPESQVGVLFGDEWHHRILLVATAQPGRWVACSTDYDVEVVDLNAETVIPFVRGLPFPTRVQGQVYSQQPLDEVRLEGARVEGRALAGALGGVVTGVARGGTSSWVYSDPGHDRFGQTVEDEVLLNPNSTVMRDSVGLVLVAGEGWTVMEHVRDDDRQLWREEKATGPGRDARVLNLQRDTRRNRFRSVREVLSEVTPLSDPAPADWPYRGPSATAELLASIRAVSDDTAQFHEHFLRTSGLAGTHPVAAKHRDLMSVFMHLACFDQLNVTQLAGVETVSRLILQIHQAVRRSPTAPDFRGLAVMTMSKLDSSGGVLTGDFARFVAEEQKSEAFTLKQQRLYAEEEEKRKAAGRKGGGGNP